MAVKKFSSAYYVVNNMDQAVNFYQDILGLDVKFRDGDRWTQFDVNGVGVALADPSEGSVPPGGGATVVLEVEDLGEMREKLTQNGVTVNETVDMGGHGKYFTAPGRQYRPDLRPLVEVGCGCVPAISEFEATRLAYDQAQASVQSARVKRDGLRLAFQRDTLQLESFFESTDLWKISPARREMVNIPLPKPFKSG